LAYMDVTSDQMRRLPAGENKSEACTLGNRILIFEHAIVKW
jgi:hypothetical protein